MSHPTTLVKDTSYWTLFQVYDPSNPGQAKAPDSLPTAVVYKNGTANGDSVTITNISTGLYKLTYNPSSEVEGDFFEIVVTAVISSVNYPDVINFTVKAAERGTDSAALAADLGTPTNLGNGATIAANTAQIYSLVGSNNILLNSVPTAGAIADAVWDEPQTDHEAGGSFGAYLGAMTSTIVSISNRIGLFSGSGLNTILGFLRAIMRSNASVPSDVGGTYAASTDSLEAQANALAALGNLGSGTYSIAITVTDGTDPVPNAHVSLAAVGQTTRSGSTDVDGLVTFSSDGSIDWEVTITAGGGLVYTPSTLSVVTSNVTTTLEMAQAVIDPPAAPNLSTGILLCLGQDGLPEEGISIFFRLVKGPTDNGYAYDSEEAEEVSGDDGIVSKDLVRGAYYTVRRGETGEPLRFLVPDEDSFSIDEIFGAP